jgi:phage terminase small subunit
MITRMQQRFVAEYLSDQKRNATQAAIRSGYSARSAKGWAWKMLQDPEIRDEIDRQLRKHLEALEVDAQMVVTGILDSIECAKRAGQARQKIRRRMAQ